MSTPPPLMVRPDRRRGGEIRCHRDLFGDDVAARYLRARDRDVEADGGRQCGHREQATAYC
jgi:hypothetical protein